MEESAPLAIVEMKHPESVTHMWQGPASKQNNDVLAWAEAMENSLFWLDADRCVSLHWSQSREESTAVAPLTIRQWNSSSILSVSSLQSDNQAQRGRNKSSSWRVYNRKHGQNWTTRQTTAGHSEKETTVLYCYLQSSLLGPFRSVSHLRTWQR